MVASQESSDLGFEKGQSIIICLTILKKQIIDMNILVRSQKQWL